MQRKREDVIKKKIYGQTYKTLFWFSGLISTIFTIVCGTCFHHYIFAHIILLNFDFVLRNREDLEKKGFTGRLWYDLIFHCLLLVLILDDLTVVELSFVSHAEGFTRLFLHASPTAFLRLMLLKPEIVVSSPCIRPQPLKALWSPRPLEE